MVAKNVSRKVEEVKMAMKIFAVLCQSDPRVELKPCPLDKANTDMVVFGVNVKRATKEQLEELNSLGFYLEPLHTNGVEYPFCKVMA